jgi:hypothetical protein
MKALPIHLPIPDHLTALIAQGAWTAPGTARGMMLNLGEDAAHRLSLEDDQLILMPPPFHTIADEIAGGNSWWNTGLSNVGEIDYSKALIIADFGMGSDSPIVLYYEPLAEPVVMYLNWKWEDRQPKHSWIRTHSSFLDFAGDVGLIKTDAQQVAAGNRP